MLKRLYQIREQTMLKRLYQIRVFFLRLFIGKWSVVANTSVFGRIEIDSPTFIYQNSFDEFRPEDEPKAYITIVED